MDHTIFRCPACNTENPITNNYCLSCGTLLKPTLVDNSQKCPFCDMVVLPTDYFCPHCSKKIRDKPLSASFGSQIKIYLISFLLPPLGLWPAFKYLRQPDQKFKTIGAVAIALTFASILISALFIIRGINQINEAVNKQVQNIMF